jgi:glycosidase
VTEPGWVRHAIWWHCYPLGFTGAYPAGGDEPHRLRRVTAWLDHAVRLGASGLALGPVFASATHGYDTTDYFRIDPRLGTDEDFDDLIAAARSRGLRVLLDGVFNHVGPGFPRAGLLRRDAVGAPATFEGHPGLFALDHDQPAVRDLVADAMTHWLGRGADGWRLDAAYQVPLPFWSAVLPRVRAAHPDAWFMGEVIHGEYPAFVREGTLDSVTQYELWKAIWSSLNDRNPHELAWTLKRHDTLLDTFVPATFVGNHDVTRIASRLDDPRALPLALVVLLTVAGTPSIYAGDEWGLRGVKEDRAGGDDAVRTEFPPTPDVPVPGADPEVLRLHQQLIGFRRRHPWLHAARTRVLELDQDRLVYESRAGDDAITVTLGYAEPFDWRIDS